MRPCFVIMDQIAAPQCLWIKPHMLLKRLGLAIFARSIKEYSCVLWVEQAAPYQVSGIQAASIQTAETESVERLGVQVHAMSHALGAHYTLPHGVCNGVLLPIVAGFNAQVGFQKCSNAFLCRVWTGSTYKGV